MSNKQTKEIRAHIKVKYKLELSAKKNKKKEKTDDQLEQNKEKK